MTEICAISPVFSYDDVADRFCLTSQCRPKLEDIGRRETAANEGYNAGLVAIYVTEDPERNYSGPPATFGRVVALVRPSPMPHGKQVTDYNSGCRELIRNQLVDRWPIGWPCKVVFFSPYGGPVLRDAVKVAFGRSDYHAFAHQMLQGPIDLMCFAMAPLRHRLMLEVRNQIALNPQTQLLPF